MNSAIRIDKTRLHKSLLKIAESEVERHYEDDNGRPSFNLYTYLESLSNQLIEPLDGGFELDPVAVARYLWCCLPRDDGEAPDGNDFRGLPVLD